MASDKCNTNIAEERSSWLEYLKTKSHILLFEYISTVLKMIIFIIFIIIPEKVFRFLKGNGGRESPKSGTAELEGQQVDLHALMDTLIKRQYYFILSAMASNISYKDLVDIKTIVENNWKMKLEGIGLYNCRNETQVMVILDQYEDRDTYIVAFRGTEIDKKEDLRSDSDMQPREIGGIGNMHTGFMRALGWPNNEEIKGDEKKPLAYSLIRDILKERLSQNEKAKFIVTGHSLGGALAILFGTKLFHDNEKLLLDRLDGIYTFGQPKVGDEVYVKYMEQKLKEHSSIKYYRFVHCYDIVPRLPYFGLGSSFYKHFGKCIFYDRHFKAKVVEKDPVDYLSSLSAWKSVVLDGIRQLVHGRRKEESWKDFLIRYKFITIMDHPGKHYLKCTLSGSLEEYLKLKLE